MKLIKDYDCTIAYHPGKTNVVADALSKKGSSAESKIIIALVRELRACKAISNVGSTGNLVARFQVKPTLEEQIVKAQLRIQH